ncbi:type I-F CRISPR-associated protein Csy3 [Oceaniserpentilla sp. 4NH20-0058]|uniref:type I-F CRISPR-associated protein Csy3 n=1 Tax=Oceaniserpentilla sp. 4NH20-0058 TaxID=3127660 RepID=UPI00310B063A
MANSNKIKLPSMLAFERKLEVSDGLMYAGNWEYINQDKSEVSTSNGGKTNWLPVQVVPRKNRSTQSAYGIKDDEKTKPNPVAADNDDANLPIDKDTLKVSFTLRVIGSLGRPFGCNDPDFEKAIQTKVKEFKSHGLKELAHRYAHNIASGRFLWRNRIGAEELNVQIKINRSQESLSFDGYGLTLNDFDMSRNNNELEKLSSALFKGLDGSEEYVLLEVDAYVRLGAGQHVFPSQEMNMNDKKKTLFKLNDCAALHSVKIGNAVRTIDNWYKDAQFPIAVEPFGSVTQRGEAYRKSKIDLYTLMLDWVNEKQVDDGQKCYVLANLIRGGVFGGKQ